MTPSMISLLCWAPFLLVILLCGIRFVILGYKRGAARAGISLGVTALSALIAVILAKLLSSTLVGVVRPIVSDLLRGKMKGNSLELLATGVAQAVCALVLYVPIFLILSIILKIVASVIFKRILPKPEKTWNRVGGLAVSAVDALVFAFLMLLPIYGTLAVGSYVTDMITDLEVIEKSGEDEGIAYLNAVANHPLAGVAGIPPFSTAYDSLMTVSVSGERLCLSGVVRSASDLVSDYAAFSKAINEQEKQRLAVSMLGDLEDLIKDSELLLTVAGDFAAESLSDVGGMNLAEIYPGFADSTFLKNDLPVLLDLIETSVESGLLDALTADSGYDPSKVDLEMLSEALGTALNGSDSLAALKSSAIREIVTLLMEKMGSSEMSDAATELLNAVANISSSPLSPDAAKKEGESLVMILNGMLLGMNDDKNIGYAAGSLLEGLARHPSVGVDKVVNAADDLLSASGKKLDGSVTAPLKDALRDSVNKPVSESTFPKLTDAAMNTVGALESVANGNVDPESMMNLITSDPEALLQMKEMVSDELLGDFGLGENAGKINSLLNSVFDSIAAVELDNEAVTKEAEALSTALVTFNGVAATPENAEQILLDNADDLIESCLESEILSGVLASATEGEGSDPMGLFGGMSEEVKETLTQKIDAKADEVDASLIESLKLFIGIE